MGKIRKMGGKWVAGWLEEETGVRALENCSKEMRCPRCSWNFHAKWQANKYKNAFLFYISAPFKEVATPP